MIRRKLLDFSIFSRKKIAKFAVRKLVSSDIKSLRTARSVMIA